MSACAKKCYRCEGTEAVMQLKLAKDSEKGEGEVSNLLGTNCKGTAKFVPRKQG